MPGTSPLSFPYAYAYAYTGRNAYAYTGNEAYSYGPGNPVLATALGDTRLALLEAGYPEPLGKSRDVGEKRWTGNNGGLPQIENAASLSHCGRQPRMSILEMELMSGISFACPTAGPAKLHATHDGQERTLLEVKRPDRALFERQLREVDKRIGDRESRIGEIVTQVAPPIAYFASIVNLQFDRHRRTIELIDAALHFAYAIGQRFKLALACPRPSDFSATLLPVIEVPQHGSLPAGHAIEATVTAQLLSHIVPGAVDSLAADYLRRMAFRIADNRIVAGVHFPVDCLVGRLMGDALSTYVLARCGKGQVQGASFDPSGGGELIAKAEEQPFAGTGCTLLGEPFTAPASELLKEQLRCACTEWE